MLMAFFSSTMQWHAVLCHALSVSKVGSSIKESIQKYHITMLGFSLSPGGLLLPYHLGALAALSFHGHLTADTHLAGSSAGAIAVAAHASGVAPEVALEASISISARSNPFFLAGGNLMPSLQHELDRLLPDDAHEIVNARNGVVGLAHLELFPRSLRPVLKTQEFKTRDCLMDAVCDSSMFPYFTTNKPFRIVKRHKERTPRVVVDGVFTEPLWRFGCPDLWKDKTMPTTGNPLDRSVSISVLPMEFLDVRLAAFNNGDKRRNIISPKLDATNMLGQMGRLAMLACTPGSSKDLIQLYDEGWSDAELWVRNEERSTRQLYLPKSGKQTTKARVTHRRIAYDQR